MIYYYILKDASTSQKVHDIQYINAQTRIPTPMLEL